MKRSHDHTNRQSLSMFIVGKKFHYYIGSFDYNSNRHKSVYAYGLTFSACELSQGKTTFGIGGSVSRTVDQTFKFGSKIQKSLLELEKILHFEPPLAKHKL